MELTMDFIEFGGVWFYVGVLVLMYLGVVMCDELNDRFKRIPFGPIRLPVIGNILHLFYYDKKYVYRALTKLAKAHGNTMKIWFGLVGSVVVSGFERINQVIRNDDWLGEQDEVWILDRTTKSRENTATQNADSIRVWATAKVYANQVLKDYGFGKYYTIESVLQSKCSDLRGLIKYWNDNNNGNIEITKSFFLPYVLGINWTFVTGEMATVEDSIPQRLLKLIKKWEELTIKTSKYLDYWPRLYNSYPAKEDYASLSGVNEEIRSLLQDLIQEYRLRGDYKVKPKNLIDKFLEKIDEREETPDKRDSADVFFSDNALISVLFNLLVPSTLVLQSTLNFACYTLSQFPEVQRRLRDDIIGIKPRNSDELNTSDFARMPYLTAFLLEVYRLGNVIPIEKRKMLKTVREGDTRVTRGMTLVINYDSANFDKATWNEPMTLNPNRFLDMSGNIVDEHKLLALVAAKRLCIGEQVARPILLHSICTLVQHFDFSSEITGGISRGLSQPEWGIINNPPSYQLNINQCY